MLILTEKAINKVKKILKEEGKENWGLRILIAGSTCCGPQFELDIEETSKKDDILIDTDGLKVFLDKESAQMLAEMQFDYNEEKEKEGFVITTLTQASSCSSGCRGCK